MRHKDFRDTDKNVSSRNFMHLNAKKVYKRCMEKVKQPRKIQCNKDYNNTPISYRAVRNWGVVIWISGTAQHNFWRLYCVCRPHGIGMALWFPPAKFKNVIYKWKKLMYSNREQSRKPRVKCRKDGELCDGRRIYSAMGLPHRLLHMGFLLYVATILGRAKGRLFICPFPPYP